MLETVRGSGFGFGKNLVLIRLFCREEHFVAAGSWEGRARSAVYTEVDNLGLFTGNA